MNKIILITLPILVGIGALVYTRGSAQEPKDVHYHAAFQVLGESDEPLDFSGAEYMSINPCGASEDGSEPHPKKIDMHDGIGDVVHVHGGTMYWGDLLVYLKLDQDKYFALINGVPVMDFSTIAISPYDSTLFVFKGHTVNPEMILSLPDKEYIEEVEQLSGTCST